MIRSWETGLDAGLGEHKRWYPTSLYQSEFDIAVSGACGRICDLARAHWPSEKRLWRCLASWKPQCSQFLLSAFLDIGLVLKFWSSFFFWPHWCLSSSSSNQYGKCLGQDADSWVNLHLRRFDYVTCAFLSQFRAACATYFKIISHCLFGREAVVQLSGNHPLLDGSQFIYLVDFFIPFWNQQKRVSIKRFCN